MSVKPLKKLVHVGDYMAEVEVNLIEDDSGWSPYLSLDDARRLDAVRIALSDGNLKRAGELSSVYRLTPVSG